MIDCPMKLTKTLSQESEASLIVLTTYFHGLAQLNYKISNLRPNKNLDHFHVKYLPFSLPTLDNWPHLLA